MVKNGPVVVAGLLALGLSVGMVGTAAAETATETATVTVAPGEGKAGIITCESGHLTGVSSRVSNASSITSMGRDGLRYTVRAASRNKPGAVTYTLTCSG